MISINLDGYYRDSQNLPPRKGIYVVYACKLSGTNIIEARIIYIGQAENLQSRHFKNGQYCHEKLPDFQKELKFGETLFYCFAEVEGKELDKVENALIAMQKPPLNDNLKNSYNHWADKFSISGPGSIHFILREFGFSENYNINSLYTEDEISFE